MNKNVWSILLAGCGMSALSMPVYAQDAETETGSPIDENVIVVTAQNRSQDVQDVPIAIDVIGTEELAESGFRDVNDIDKIAPVTMINQVAGSVSITVRGIGTTGGGSQDNSVVTNIDGEWINSPTALNTALFDLERVEVLRGPQGTLYGRNATGGAINFITRKPGNDFGANASISYGNYDSVRADAGVDIPMGDMLAARLAGFYEDRDGYVKHPAMAAGIVNGFSFPGYEATRSNDNHAWGGRASLLADPMDRLTVYLAGEYSEREFTPQVEAAFDAHQPQYNPGPDCSNAGWEPTAPLITDQTLCIPSNTDFLEGFDRTEFAAPAAGVGRSYFSTYAIRGRIDYEITDDATLSYIGGYRYFERDPRTRIPRPVVYTDLVVNSNIKTQSHELRLAGETNSVTYQLGAFYFIEDEVDLGGFYLGNVYFDGNVVNGSPRFGPTGAGTTGQFINYRVRDSVLNSKSLFAQVEVPLTDAFTGVGGIRYTNNKLTGVWNDMTGGLWRGPFERWPGQVVVDANGDPVINAATGEPIGEPAFTPTLYPENSASKITWLVGVNYEPDPDTLIYGKVSTGFKGGGFDTVGNFGPETNTAFETGLKKGLGEFGQHLFNLTAFYYDYKGLQVNVLLNSAEGGRTFNAGSATIWGIEADTSFKVSENSVFNLSVNYLQTSINELFALYNVYCVSVAEGGVGNCRTSGGSDINAVGDVDPNTPGVQAPDFAGNELGYSPEWIISAGYDHTFELGSAGALTASINSQFKSQYFTTFNNWSDSSQEAFTKTDITLEYESLAGFTVAAFVQNIENERTLSQGQYLSAGPDDIYNFTFGSPRLYGVRVGYEF
jgi:iron complex outermembrane receptor protein